MDRYFEKNGFEGWVKENGKIDYLKYLGKDLFFPSQELLTEPGIFKKIGGLSFSLLALNSSKNRVSPWTEMDWEFPIQKDGICFIACYEKLDLNLNFQGKYEFSKEEIKVSFQIENQSKIEVEVGINWYSYFNAPKGAKVLFRDIHGLLQNYQIKGPFKPQEVARSEAVLINLQGIGDVKIVLSPGFQSSWLWSDWVKEYFILNPHGFMSILPTEIFVLEFSMILENFK